MSSTCVNLSARSRHKCTAAGLEGVALPLIVCLVLLDSRCVT